MFWQAGAPTFFSQISASTSRMSFLSQGSPRTSIMEVIPEKQPAVVSAQWLIEALFVTGGDFVHQESDTFLEKLQYHPVSLLDATWKADFGFDGYEQHYKRGHIPGAIFLDLQALCSPHSIPEPDNFERFVSNLGITKNTHVVTYDSLDSRSAARAWFLFKLFGHDRVSVLDGGLRQWVQDGHEICTECAGFDHACRPDQCETQHFLSTQPTHKFKAMLRPDMLRNFVEMKTIVENGEAQIIDCRPELSLSEAENSSVSTDTIAMTSATSPFGIPSAGHIPGAINIPFTNFFNSDGTFKPEEELMHVFETAGVDLSVPTVVYSQRGITSCTVVLASVLCGVSNLPIYNGSWAEWETLAPASLIAERKIPIKLEHPLS